MDICSVITSFTSGGAETLVCNLARHFTRLGHRASVVALSNAAEVGNSSQTEQQMMERLRADGIGAASLGLGARRSILKGRRALGRYLADFCPDIVHLHTARATLMAGGAGVPLILTHHNSRLSFSPHLYRLFDQFVHAYVGISAACAAQTRSHARRPVRLIVNGAEVRTARDSPRSSPSPVPKLIAVGTISDQKDYPALIAAAGHLRSRLEPLGKSFDLQIVGGGDQLAKLQELVRAQGLEKEVRLLGVRSDVPDLLGSADLFVNSSRYEGMSIAMLEGLISALPVVATNVPGNDELVRHGENGLLVPPGDPEALASAIATLVLNRGLYAQLSNGALASSKPFTIERCAEEHLALYEDALAQSAPRRAA